MENTKNLPLVSVIIPCFNQGHYLVKSIQSVREQTYPNVEIIVINDGSTDETAKIAASFPDIKYVFQENSGLANARNRGISESEGTYVAFLDADDWFYPEAIERNVHFLKADPALAFVSGIHDVYIEGHHEIRKENGRGIEEGHFKEMLLRNYIGNPAAVLYHKWVLEMIPFDNAEEIRGCEDYDHYLKITRNYPVLHHPGKISVYRKHGENMSYNHPMMLSSALYALNRQAANLKTEDEKRAFEMGRKNWEWYYLNQVYLVLRFGKHQRSKHLSKNFLWKHRKGLTKIVINKILVKADTLLVNLKIRK